MKNIKIVFSFLTALVGLLAMAGIGHAQPVTPRGTAVTDYSYPTEFSAWYIAFVDSVVCKDYENATFISSSSNTYNCHGYAWHMTEGGSAVWIGSATETAEDVYWTDGSYCEVSSDAQAEKVNFPDPGSSGGNHSAITTSTSGTYESKWGFGPVMSATLANDPYSATVKFYTKNDDPGADVLGFTVVNGEASWFLESLYRTESLVLEGRLSKDDDWEPLAITLPMRVGRASVDVGSSGYNFFRLVETETSGNQLVHGEVRAQTVNPAELVSRAKNIPTLEQTKARFEEVRDKSLASGYSSIQRATASGLKLSIYTNGVMYWAVTMSIASFWSGAGYTVSVHSVDGYPSDPDDFRSILDIAIASEAAGGTGFFLLVGDANDWVEFSQPWPGDWEDVRQGRINAGYPAGGEPQKDIIPTWIIPDPLPRGEGMSYVCPYWFTDQPYADTNGDDIPDVVVSRLPFTNSAEVYGYATKLWDETASWDADNVAFLIGNRIRSDSDGTRARLAAWNVMEHVPPYIDTETLYWSQCWYDTDRNTLPADLINTEEPELIVEISSLSNRYYPGDFFDKTIGYIPWTMSLLTSTQPLVFLAASCGGADYARTESPTYQTTIPHEFLAESGKGAVVWIGPTAGSWQNGNEVIASYIIDELFEDPERPIGDSYNNAIRRALIVHADNPDIVKTARSYQMLGDPLVPFMFTPPPPPPSGGGGCPHVYTYNGDSFVMDNTILGLVGSGDAGNPEVNISDTYVLQHNPVADNGFYRIEIREFEQEHVYLDCVELFIVDHPEDTELVVTEAGDLVLHRDWILPVAARDGRNQDLLDVLSQNDNVVFEGKKGDVVTLTYRIPRGSNIGFATRAVKKKDIATLPEPGAAISSGIEVLLRKNQAAGYLSLGGINPREYAAHQTRFITDRLYAEGIVEGEFEIQLVWHTEHDLDFAGLFSPLPEDPQEQSTDIQHAVHSKSWGVQMELADADGRFVELVPGESISLSFAALDAQDQNRSFVLKTDGHYVVEKLEEKRQLPSAVRLYPAQPNPFNPATTIRFDLPAEAHVTLNVYSVDGRLVATLTDEVFPAGRHNVKWNGRDRDGREMSSGVYFYKLTTPRSSETRKMTLLK
jgi:hypothetical protein